MPTEKPENEIWEDDLLSRARHAELIRRFIVGQMSLKKSAGQEATYVLNIDAEWGVGKSFFITRFQQHLESMGHVAVYVDAWKSDHAADPLLAIFSDLKHQLDEVADKKHVSDRLARSLVPLKQSVGRLAVKVGTGVLRTATTRLAGEEVSDELFAVAGSVGIDEIGNKLLASFEEEQTTIETFRVSLGQTVEVLTDETDVEPPVFILIDELDRCRPSYAIETLERIKHLFSVKNVAFIVSTDTRQLGAAVAGVYGGSFDGAKYLERFFDRTFKFPQPELVEFIKFNFRKLSIDPASVAAPLDADVYEFAAQLFQKSEMPTRQIEKSLGKLQTLVSVWEYEVPIQLAYALPLIHEEQLRSEGRSESNSGMRNVTFPMTRRDRNGKPREDTVSVGSFVDAVERVGDDIFDQAIGNSENAHYLLIDRVFHRERTALHRSQFTLGSKTPSVMLLYSKMIGELSTFDE
jgi:hypothetical protein